MYRNEREEQIINILRGTGFVTVKKLGEILYSSESSIRRDLTRLENKGVVHRSYGGAKLVMADTNVTPFNTRAFNNIDAKKEIARKAASIINDGSIIFLDQSSTSFFLAKEICERNSLTVITNNIEILNLLSQYDMSVHSSGGVLSKVNRNCLIGKNAQTTFENIYADFCFFSAKSLSSDGVVSDCTEEEVFVRKSMLQNAQRRVFLCNYSKIGTHSNFKQCSLNDVDYLICEKQIDSKIVNINKNLKTI